MRVYPISIWFVCKSCGFTFIFRNVDDILNHKKKMHLAELKKTQCIVFEEKRTEFIDDGEESDADTAPAIEVNDKDIVDEDEGNRSRISALNDDETEFKVCIEEDEPLSPSGSENNRTVVEQRSSGKQCPTRVPGAVTELQDVQSLELDVSENVDPATHENENDSYVTCANEDPEIETTSIGFINDVDEGIQEFNSLNEQRSSDESDDGRDSPMEIDDDLGSPVPDSPELDSTSNSQKTSQSQTHDLIQTGGQLTSEATATATSSNIELESEIPVPVSRNFISRAGLAKKSRKSRFSIEMNRINSKNSRIALASRRLKLKRPLNTSRATDKPFECPQPNCSSVFNDFDALHHHRSNQHQVKQYASASKAQSQSKVKFGITTSSEQTNDVTIDNSIGSDTEENPLTLVDWLKSQQNYSHDSGTVSTDIDFDANVILLEPDPTKCPDLGLISSLNPIECKLCCKKLTSEKDVKFHVKCCWLHNKHSHRYCIPCKKEFRTPYALRSHFCSTKVKHPKSLVLQPAPPGRPWLLLTKESESQSYVCTHCDQGFETCVSFRNHSKATHSDDKPFKCPEPSCRKSFVYQKNLRIHGACHKSERPFSCTWKNCLRTFKISKELIRHLKLHSSGKVLRSTDKEYKCTRDSCDTVFYSCTQFKRHCKEVHSDSRPFYCPELNCSMSFPYEKELRSHGFSHTDERPFKCTKEGCSKTFKTIKILKLHMKSFCNTRSKQLKCPEDSGKETFDQSHQVKDHVKDVHGVGGGGDLDPGTGNYPCKTCKETFRTKFDLHEHVSNIHYQFKCPFEGCTASYPRKCKLKDHENFHTGERPYLCKLCNKTFASKNNLHKHKIAVHKESSSKTRGQEFLIYS